MADVYTSMTALFEHEIEGTDYRLVARERDKDRLFMAPHGGWIEPVTSEIAAGIAGSEWSLFLFEGAKRGRPHGDL